MQKIPGIEYEFEIVRHPAPVTARAEKEFGVKFNNGTIFAYAPYIHDRSGKVPTDICVHELVHFRQQEAVGGPDKWWDIYFMDSEQRFSWEIEAYREQFAWIKQNMSRKDYFAKLKVSSGQLVRMYNFDLTIEQARELIMNGASYPQMH